MKHIVPKLLAALIVAAMATSGGAAIGAKGPTKLDLDGKGVLPGAVEEAGCPGLALATPLTLFLQNDRVEDVYCVTGNAGERLTIRADTSDPLSAHDLHASVCTTTTFSFFSCVFFDDNFACTFPPPAYACPQGTVTLGASGTYYIIVGSWGVWGGTWSGPLLYTLTADINGTPATVDLFAFDQPQTGY